MASIRKRGSSYLIVVSMGYDYNGKRIKPQQKTVHPPEELTPRQVENGSTSRPSCSSGNAATRRSPSSSSRWQNTSTCG